MSAALRTKVLKTYRQPGGDEFRLDVAAEFTAGVTAVFGPSGSGKSTWLECISGLVRPVAGKIELGSEVVFDSALDVELAPGRRSIGYVFQSAALFPHLTVRENVQYGLHQSSAEERRDVANRMMEELHIGHLAEKRPAQISGGERQRAALARALVRRPRCLLLDEPFSALDHSTKRKIMDDVLAWNQDHNVPVLLVTHALEEVLTMAQRVIILDKGRIAADGEPRAVLAEQRQELIASL